MSLLTAWLPNWNLNLCEWIYPKYFPPSCIYNQVLFDLVHESLIFILFFWFSGDPYACFPCAESEWSDEGSAKCKARSVVYLQFTEISSIAVMISATCLIILLFAIFGLFTYNYNTPVVRSAGGSMCFLMLTCLIMSSISVFFFFGQPTSVHCLLRNVIFAFFFIVFLSCMAVRSFQIVCIFKMAAKFPSVHSLWVKYNGQWLFVGFFSVIHLISCVLWMTVSAPKAFRDSLTFKDQIILSCEMGNTVTISIVVSMGWFLGFLCLLFSYMGRDLPKKLQWGQINNFQSYSAQCELDCILHSIPHSQKPIHSAS